MQSLTKYQRTILTQKGNERRIVLDYIDYLKLAVNGLQIEVKP